MQFVEMLARGETIHPTETQLINDQASGFMPAPVLANST